MKSAVTITRRKDDTKVGSAHEASAADLRFIACTKLYTGLCPSGQIAAMRKLPVHTD